MCTFNIISSRSIANKHEPYLPYRSAIARMSLLRRSFRNLCHAAKLSARETSALHLRSRRACRTALVAWRMTLHHGREVRALRTRSTCTQLLLCMQHWRERCLAQRRKAAVGASALRLRRRRLLSGCLRGWLRWLRRIEEVSRLAASPELEALAAQSRAAGLRQRAFRAWRLYLTGRRLPKVGRSLCSDRHPTCCLEHLPYAVSCVLPSPV